MVIKRISKSNLEKEIENTHRTCEHFEADTCPHINNIEACSRISAVRISYQMSAFHDNQEVHYGVRV